MYKNSKWSKEIIALQNEDGLWGYFHTLSDPSKNPITTEQALRRLQILGYTIDDACIQKTVQYMHDCLIGKKDMPDRREKTHDWDIFTQLMLSTWIRRFTKDDSRDAFERWTSSNDSEFWEPAHKSIEETEEIINEYVENYKNSDWYMWAIELENELIGLVCGNEINEDIRSICIGYCITRSCWNKGIATEALRAVLSFAFKQMKVNRITGRHHIDNAASGRVMEKCGFRYEGTLRQIIKDGRGNLVDCKYYSILKNEFIDI
jgi:ribosomal-protein-alanine N-acetyltransferase